MLRVLLLLALPSLVTLNIQAQHCAFDYDYLLGVRPFDKDSSRIIEGLTVTLVDEFQRPVKLTNNAQLKQNDQKKMSHFGKSVAHEDLQYWFAPNDYVGIGNLKHANSTNLFIKIEDLKPRKSPAYKTQIIPISGLNFISLCSYHPDFEKDKFKNYRPIWVDLSTSQFQSAEKIFEVHPFIFRLDEHPKSIEACEAPSCYAMHLEIFSAGNNQKIHEEYFSGIRTINDQKNPLQIADFNFDGYQDFSFFDNSKRQYFLFHVSESKFKRDSLLSSFDSIELDTENKRLIGRTYQKQFDGLQNSNDWAEFRLSGIGLAQVELIHVSSQKGKGILDKEVVDSLIYKNGKLSPQVKEDKGSTTRSISVKGFRFEREIQTYYQPEDQGIKPPGWTPTLAAVAIYRIYRIADNQQIFTISGESYANYQGGEFNKEPHVKDVDFDGWPELIIPFPGSMTPNRYYGFDQKQNTFKELFISYLQDLQIDEKSQSATGFRFEGQASSPYPTAKIHYILQGPGLPIVKERREELPQPERKPQAPNLVLFSKIENHYLVEVKLLDALDLQKLKNPTDASHKITIINQRDKNQSAVLYLKAKNQRSPQQLEAGIDIKFLNFDAFPDLVFDHNLFEGDRQIWLSCLNEGVLTYYLDKHLSKIQDYELDPSNQIIRGSYIEGSNRIFYELHYLFEPFAIIITQATTNPKNATRAIYENNCGVLKSKKAGLIPPIIDK